MDAELLKAVTDLGLVGVLAVAVMMLWRQWTKDRAAFEERMDAARARMETVLTNLIAKNQEVIEHNTNALEKLCDESPERAEVKREHEQMRQAQQEMRQTLTAIQQAVNNGS